MEKVSPTKKSRSSLTLIDRGRKTQHPKLLLCGFEIWSIPKEVFKDPFPFCLEHLDLSNNYLDAVSNEIKLLENLKTLILSGNSLTGLPKEIGELRKLETLDVSRNKLSSLRKEINNLKELKAVNLSGNKLTLIPEYLLSLPKLKKVFCIRNEQLRNVPRHIAAEGLEAMRIFLQIQVEEYECFREEKKRDKKLNKTFDGLLEEIEKQWVLEDEQFVRKTKDACTQLDDDDCDSLDRSVSRMSQSRVSAETCTSTQTEFNDANIINDEDQQKFISSCRSPLRYSTGSNQHPLSPRAASRGGTDEDKAIEELVKIFHNQIDLVNESKTKCLLKKQRKMCDDVPSICNSTTGDTPSRRNHVIEQCHGCGLKRRDTLTSEYGSMSSYSRMQSDSCTIDGDDDSCDCNDGSLLDSHLSDAELDETSELTDYDESSSEYDKDEFWSSVEERYMNACKELVIRQNGIGVTIPEMNLSGHKHSDFSFEVVNETEFAPSLTSNAILATPIVHASPHGARFYLSMEASVKLPLHVVVGGDIIVHCFESDTDIDEPPVWQEIQNEAFEIVGQSVVIKTKHFSLFCATVSKEYPHVEKRISPANGGSLYHEEVPGLEVNFTKGCINNDIDASLTVLYDDDDYKPTNTDRAIASPVVALGPHGISFKDDVIVTLPLPDASEVFKIVRDPELIILESRTKLGEKTSWKTVNVSYEIIEHGGVYSVSFAVRHFTLFEALWNIANTTVQTVKKASNLFPKFTYLVYFQALMSDYYGKQFGLRINCLLAGNPPVTDCSQFPIDVGRSMPKELKTGDVVVGLKSTLFSSDDEVHGESEERLSKSETFNGREFGMQFGLRFHDQFKEGIFGKVTVSRSEGDGTSKDVAEFLLQKAIQRRNKITDKLPTELESTAVREIAGILSIEDRWKELALTLGYTRRETDTKFDSDDPIHDILTDFMARGGEADKFLKAMYEVARRLRLIPYEQLMENRENRRMENRDVAPSTSRYCNCPQNPEKTPLRKVKRKLNASFDEDEELTDAKLDRIAGQIAKSWKHVGRSLGIGEKKIAEIDQNNQNEGEREKGYQMFMVWKEMDPDNFNAEMLGRTLYKCDLKFTARQFLGY